MIVSVSCLTLFYYESYKTELKLVNYNLDVSRSSLLESCTMLGACEGLKCLCETMVSENNYCSTYKELCVDNACEEFVKTVNNVSFVNYQEDTFSSCVINYDRLIIVEDIDLIAMCDEQFVCLSKHRRNMGAPAWQVYTFRYREGNFFDENGMIIGQ